MNTEDLQIAHRNAARSGYKVSSVEYARADKRDANVTYNRLDWRAKSVLGATVVQQITAQVNNCCVLYGAEPSEGIFAVY